jgi:cell division protein FtsW
MSKTQLDRWIFYTTLGLIAFGIIMVYSASAFYADKFQNDHLFYLKKQLLWVFMGIVLILITYKFPYEHLQGWCWLFIVISVFLLGYLLVTQHTRWIPLGFFHIQVSDIARMSLIFFFADSLSRKEKYLKSFKEGFIPHVFYIFFIAGLITVQPDFSSAFMIVLIGMSILFISTIPMRYFFLTFISISVIAGLIIKFSPYKFDRINAFLHPEQDVLGNGYQIIQSLISLGSGGITGVGFAQSNQKLFFLPEAHTDFIYSIIGEEWGLIGTIFILALFFILLWRGFTLTRNATDKFSRYLAFGLTINLVLYALINMMVSSHLAPPTGLPLPFISYGGSSMLTSCISIGLLLNISRKTNYYVIKNNNQFAYNAVQNYKNRKLRYIK